jgi:hypothetical protein
LRRAANAFSRSGLDTLDNVAQKRKETLTSQMETFEKCPLNIFFALKKRGTTIWTLIPHNLFLILQIRGDAVTNLWHYTEFINISHA